MSIKIDEKTLKFGILIVLNDFEDNRAYEKRFLCKIHKLLLLLKFLSILDASTLLL